MDDGATLAGDMLERIVRAIDPAMPVPVPVQLRGVLEYGIATGEIEGGVRLPSVRRLAARLGLSPVTVSGIFATLQERGHVEGRVGLGTFVTGGGAPTGRDAHRQSELGARIDAVAALARVMGLTAENLSWRLANAMTARQAVRIAVLGTFPEATTAYADALRLLVRAGDVVTAVGVEDATAGALPFDLILAPRTILSRAATLFLETPAVAMTLIPNEASRVALAAVAPDARVAAVSYFDDFLSVMAAGIGRFAPHVIQLRTGLRGDPDLADLLGWCDVLVHSTGADYLRAGLAPGQAAIEYRHTPDAHHVRTEILPAIEAVRARQSAQESGDEDKRQQLVRDRALP